MNTDGYVTADSASRHKAPSAGLRAFAQEILAVGVIAICGTLAFLLVDVKTTLVKHNDLISQQIAVTRSMHFVHELAIAYKENRRASEAAEKADIPPLPQEDFRSQFEFQK